MSWQGPRLALAVGGVVLGLGYLVAFFLMDAPWQLLVASCVASAGVGIAYAAMPTLILGSTRPDEAGSAVGINALMRSVGTTTAAAVMTTVLASSADGVRHPEPRRLRGLLPHRRGGRVRGRGDHPPRAAADPGGHGREAPPHRGGGG